MNVSVGETAGNSLLSSLLAFLLSSTPLYSFTPCPSFFHCLHTQTGKAFAFQASRPSAQAHKQVAAIAAGPSFNPNGVPTSHAAAAACTCHYCIHHPRENQDCYSQNQHYPQDQHHRHVPLHLAPACVAKLGGGGGPAVVLVDAGGSPSAGHSQKSRLIGDGHG